MKLVLPWSAKNYEKKFEELIDNIEKEYSYDYSIECFLRWWAIDHKEDNDMWMDFGNDIALKLALVLMKYGMLERPKITRKFLNDIRIILEDRLHMTQVSFKLTQLGIDCRTLHAL